jgi:hypothetical protein
MMKLYINENNMDKNPKIWMIGMEVGRVLGWGFLILVVMWIVDG